MPNSSVRKVAVIGSGVMGGQIAAYLTNVGVSVLLLGVVSRGSQDRNAMARGAVERWLKASPSPFMNSKNADLITPGNVEDNFECIKDADWIIEAITEDLNAKRELYKKIDEIRKTGSIVSSSAATINILQLIEGQSERFARDMMITRFVNPLRGSRTMEIVISAKTREDAAEFISDFCDRRLGKEVIICKDTTDALAGKESHLYAGNMTGALLLDSIKRAAPPLISNPAASLWNIGDGVLCLELHTKMNTINMDTFKIINQTIAAIRANNKRNCGEWYGLVICGSGDNFSVGADLKYILSLVKSGAWREFEDFLWAGAEAYSSIRFASFPTVAAIHGLTLGGGCELALHSSAIQAHVETYMGLVEVGVGLIPGWGGCTQMFVRAMIAQQQKTSNIPPANRVFETIGLSKRSKSAPEAVDMQYLKLTDGITMNCDRLLYDAKKRVIDLAKGYEVQRMSQLSLSGKAGRTSLDFALESMKVIGKLSPHDITVCKSLEMVLCGDCGPYTTTMSEERMMVSERRELMKLIKTPETIARIEHLLESGELLKN